MTEPLFPWIGGKRRLIDKLLPLFPAHECYVEAFAGAAALLLAKAPSPVEVLNDINGELVRVYRVVKHHPEELARQFRYALSSREYFEWHKITPPETLTDVQRAARFLYLQQLCFGGKATAQTFGTGTTSPPGLNIFRLEEQISAVHLRLANTYIEHLPWQKCVDRYDRAHTLFYFDPPYWETEGYGVPFDWIEYERLASTMRSIKGRAVLSINDHPKIRACFAGFKLEELDITYTLAGGGQHADRRELVIFSWDAGVGGLFG